MSSGMEEKDDPGKLTAKSFFVKDKRKVTLFLCGSPDLFL